MKKEQFVILRDTDTKNGEKRYGVNIVIGEFFGNPAYRTLFVGTLEQCEEYIKNKGE